MRRHLRKISRMSWVGLMLLFFGLSLSCSKSPAPDEEPAPPLASPASSAVQSTERSAVRVDRRLVSDGRVRVESVARRAVSDDVLASAEVIPAVDGIAVIGAMVSGRIAQVLVREGDVVKRGQVLAWIDAPEAARIQGDYLRARARLRRAQQNVDREQALWKDKATSERAVKEAEAELREVRADEAAALGLLSSARVPIPSDDAIRAASRIGVFSPIDGVVSKHNAVVGTPVGLEDSLFEVIDPKKLTIRADVPEAAARRVRANGKAVVVPHGVHESCVGKVRAKLETIDSVKRTMGVLVDVDPTCHGLVAGGFAEVTLTLAAATGAPSLVVPRTAVVQVDGVTSVFVLDKNAEPVTFVSRNVRLGLSDGTHVVIEEGLRDGDELAVVGSFLLKGEHMKQAVGAK